MSLLYSNSSDFSKCKSTLKEDSPFDFGQLSLDEETPKCAVITRRLSLALLTVSGRPNLWTLSVLMVNFSVNLCAAGLSVYEISLEHKSSEVSK